MSCLITSMGIGVLFWAKIGILKLSFSCQNCIARTTRTITEPYLFLAKEHNCIPLMYLGALKTSLAGLFWEEALKIKYGPHGCHKSLVKGGGKLELFRGKLPPHE